MIKNTDTVIVILMFILTKIETEFLNIKNKTNEIRNFININNINLMILLIK